MCSELISAKVVAPKFYTSILYRMVNSQDRNLYAQDKTFLATKQFKVGHIETLHTQVFCTSGLTKQNQSSGLLLPWLTYLFIFSASGLKLATSYTSFFCTDGLAGHKIFWLWV